MQNNINIVKSFSNPQLYAVNPIVSRSTIRELSDNPSYEGYESYLHTARMYVLMMGMDFDEALAFANKWDPFGWYKKMCDAGYLEKQLLV